MYQIKINNIAYEIPSERNEVTLSKFLALREIDIHSTLEVIYWAIGAKPFFKESDTVEQEFGVAFSFAKMLIESIYDFTESKMKFDIPNSVEVLGVNLEIKKGLLNDLPYWPYVVTKFILAEEMKKTPFDPTARYPEILAHYLYSAVVKAPYDENKASEFIEVANEISFPAALQLGNFFLKRQKDYPLSRQKSFRQLMTSKFAKRA